MIKSFFILMVWIAGSISPNAAVSMVTSVIAGVYFASMLKINVVDKKYDGSWTKFFKSWFG